MVLRLSCIRSEPGVILSRADGEGPADSGAERSIATGPSPSARLRMTLMIALVATSLFAADRRRTIAPLPDASCPLATTCTEGGAAFSPLAPAEVTGIVNAAAAALDVNTATIAVVDRTGRPLALFRQPGANPANDDQAIGVARTAAFFSHNMAPLSSRTVRFISGIHFPPGIENAPVAALYGIENTNRGCGFNVTFNAGKCIDPATSVSGGPGPGIVTGKVQPDDSDPNAVNAGGVPIYRNGALVGGIGVVGIPGDPQLAEFAAVSGSLAGFLPVPVFPLPFPGNVFIDGIRLPFLGDDIKITGAGLQRLAGTHSGSNAGTFVITPQSGTCAPNEYLVGPNGGTISATDVDAIVKRAVAKAKRTRAAIRLPLNSYTRMVIAVADLDGTILAIYRMPDATVFSIDVAVAKARNVIYFSTTTTDLPGIAAGTAVTNRTIGFGAQPLFPPGISSHAFDVRTGPFYPLFLKDLANPCTQGSQAPNANQNGIVFFPGASPLYANNKLAGGLGVSGDGVEQDDYVTTAGAGPFLPPESMWADRITIDGVRLPMFKYPRHPEGVTECGGGPCS